MAWELCNANILANTKTAAIYESANQEIFRRQQDVQSQPSVLYFQEFITLIRFEKLERRTK